MQKITASPKPKDTPSTITEKVIISGIFFSFKLQFKIIIGALFYFIFHFLPLCFDFQLTLRNLKPRVEMMPATNPISIAPNGPMLMSAHVPTATPPAKVAFWMCTCRNIKKIKHLTELFFLKIISSVIVDIKWRSSDHVQFSFVLHQTGDGVGREHTGSQGEVGVDDCSELTDACLSDGRVKTGPEHPQEDSSCRRES